MTTYNYPLSRLAHEFGKNVIDDESGLEVFHAPSPHALIQAAGYLKHVRAKQEKKAVFFRGQTKLYPTLGPTLLRGVSDTAWIRRRNLLKTFLFDLDAKKLALKAVKAPYREALLQHYGIRTTWLDVVDNIWIALWFACHLPRTVIRGDEEYMHFEKRIPTTTSDAAFAYVVLLESAYFGPTSGEPGHYIDKNSETIDLRVAVPSHFVRPHAQHGLLVRKLSNTGQPSGDCIPLHVGTIRVDLAAALDWLGTASTLTVHSIFPPAYYDYGYRELLQFVKPSSKTLGFIHRVQP